MIFLDSCEPRVKCANCQRTAKIEIVCSGNRGLRLCLECGAMLGEMLVDECAESEGDEES